jgi:hypothetical protein
MTEPTEKLPISDFYKVIEYVTIFKSKKWWEAIVVYEASGKRSIGLYLWENKTDVWKRKNKFSVRTLEEWTKIKNTIDQLAPKLASK